MNDLPTVYKCDNRKARKDHKCYECQGKINIGESYNYHHGIWSGEPEDFNVCLECDELRFDVNEGAAYDETAAFGSLYEHVFESQDLEFMKRYVALRQKRGAKFQPWMSERIEELENSTASKERKV